MRRWIYVLPVAAFAAIAFFLFHSLLLPPPQILPSVLLDKPAPGIALTALDAQARGFSRADLASGHVTVVNFFASWCLPCREEAPSLMTLAKKPGVILYGVAYKDKRADSREFLTEGGNPFSAVVADDKGLVAIDWGVTAAPETFVVDGKGIIRFRYNAGPLTDDIVRDQLLPAIEQARQAD